MKLKKMKYAGISSELKDSDHDAAKDLMERIEKLQKKGFKENDPKDFKA